MDPKPPKQKSRLGFIDTIRGIAACLVMLQHSMEAGRIEHLAKGFFGLSWINFGETGVLAFFLVSGFVIPLSLEKWNDVKHFWLNRAFRIYPLYLFIYGVTLAVNGSHTLHSLGQYFANFLSNLLFIQEYLHQENFVGGSWTLSLEAVWYLGFTILFVLGINKRTRTVVVGASALALAAAALSLSGLARVPMGRVNFLLACVAGLLCYRRERDEVSPREFAQGCLVLLAVMTFNLAVGFHWRPGDSSIAPSFRCVLISWALGALVFFAPYLKRSSSIWNGRALTFIGKISYSIYLVHPVMLALLGRAGIHGVAFVALVFVSTVVVSALTYRCVESPAIAYSHSLRNRAPVPAKA